jgi:hypothetical protein
VVASVPGGHEDLELRDDSVACLAKILNEQVGPALVTQLARTSAKVQELATKLALSEADEEVKRLRGELRARRIKERNKQLKASTSWRITAPLRAVSRGLGSLLARKSNRSNLAG